MFNISYLHEYVDNAPKICLNISKSSNLLDDDCLIQLIAMSVYYYRIDISTFFGCLDSGLLA